MKNKFQPIIFSLLIILGILIGKNLNNKKNIDTNEKINSIINLINSNYVDSVNKNFEDQIINSIIKDLDPHTSYISKKNYQSVEENMLGGFSGIGIEFNIIDDTIVVVSPINGGPSQKLGIISGDRIVTVDSINVASIGIENNDVIKKLRGCDNFLWVNGFKPDYLPSWFYSYREGWHPSHYWENQWTPQFKYNPNFLICLFHQKPDVHELESSNILKKIWNDSV